eukprot:TRINITY_DN3073_c0_g1_i1.p1 TRINITY_DN3073_c0_g1~~TRINITY_DN3073_c0_g1_i1.p1  ORF type:complete len:57 (-),score=0.71 TRINITY_DN3073_c0_g1_i1:91-261(-)
MFLRGGTFSILFFLSTITEEKSSALTSCRVMPYIKLRASYFFYIFSKFCLKYVFKA